MKLANVFRIVTLTGLLGATGALAQGCGPSAGSYCKKVCDCVGCSASQLDECVDTVDDTRKAAGDDGCDSEFGDYLSCLDSELTCKNDVPEADGCENEAEALSKCSSSVSIGVSPSSYCSKVCDCQGCTNSELASCVSEIESAQNQAASFGCSASFDDLLSCVNAGLTCQNGQLTFDGCDAETNAYVNCANGGTNGGSGGSSPGGSGSGGGA